LTLLAVWVFLGEGGCAYHGDSETNLDNPAVQKFSWFSFLDGHDIREACAPLGPKAPGHYRLVYNGQYSEQIRTYEVNVAPSGGATLLVRAKGPTNLSNWWIQSPDDLLAPWRWREATAALSPAETAQFRAVLARSGFGSGAPQGLRLSSQDFYWVAAGCEAGQFHYYAWVERDGRLDAAQFQDFLIRHDGTGLPLRLPHILSVSEAAQTGPQRTREREDSFTLEVRGEGLGGLVNAF
jgi:hypothetical protein